MNLIPIKPVDGRLVRDPATGREIVDQTNVDGNDPFWIRRIADGDVAVVKHPADAEIATGRAARGDK